MRQPNENVIKHNYNIQRYNGESYYFETCNQFDKLESYCWTKSYLGPNGAWGGLFITHVFQTGEVKRGVPLMPNTSIQ